MASPPQPKKLKMSTTSNSSADDIAPSTGPHPPTSPSDQTRRRYKRRKIAIFLSYCGAGYQGMQKNPGVRTIEGDLEEALFAAGAVPDRDRGNPKRYDWARSARTDKGVSAAGQVVSGRFYIDPPGFVDRLNSVLADQIRILGFKRVTNSFNAKKFCDRRRYIYLLPVFALDPTAHRNRECVIASLGSENELGRCVECSERGRKVPGVIGRQFKPLKEQKSDLGGNEGGEVLVEVEMGSSCVNTVPNEETNSGIKTIEEKHVSIISTIESVGVNVEAQAGANSSVSEKQPVLNSNESEEKSDLGGNEGGEVLVEVEMEPSCVNTVPNEETNSGIKTIEEKDVSIISTIESVGVNIEAQACANSSVSEKQPVLNSNESESKVLVGINGGKKEGAAGTFCYGDKERESFKAILKRYEGTHNFHNFTTRTKAEDPSARRYIISFNADSVISIGGIEFIKCEVVGQSFMLHQIRKMIGLAVALMRNCAPESLMDIALKPDVNINVPTAPEVGLYLDECFFSSYNKKWNDSHEEVSMEAFAEEVEEFKVKYIYSHIASMEHKEGAVALWLHSLNHRNYPDFLLEEKKEEQKTGIDNVVPV